MISIVLRTNALEAHHHASLVNDERYTTDRHAVFQHIFMTFSTVNMQWQAYCSFATGPRTILVLLGKQSSMITTIHLAALNNCWRNLLYG